MFTKVLIANRGAIACRIERTLQRLEVESVAVFSEADRHSPHVRNATGGSVLLGPAPARESYLLGDKIIAAALELGAEAIHPGYGFLSENADFAEACEAAGVTFIGPTPAQMRQFGRKHTARELAAAANVPMAPGTGLLVDEDAAAKAAGQIGYPVMLKSTGGGGGIGMSVCRGEGELRAAFQSVKRLGESNFKDAGVFLEKFVENARHVEVQVFGDGKGNVAILGERDCTLQRRNQKVVEETPAPDLPEETRQALWESARRLAASVQYRNAGTVEFLYDADTNAFYFLEVNTRLQVEHGVTEEVWGVDLVEWMLRQAAGEDLRLAEWTGAPRGHAMQVRLYAETPHRGFTPSSGLITEAAWSPAARVETWIEPGLEVTSYYDPMLAKIIVHGEDRGDAHDQLALALEETRVSGFATNLEYLREIIFLPEFGEQPVTHTTRTLGQVVIEPRAVEILDPGTMTTVQDHPGRLGYWDVGVPPSGPMDALSFRLANQLVGNPDHLAGLEMTATGVTLRFLCNTAFCLTGALAAATLDGQEVAYGWRTEAAAGSVLKIGRFTGPGCRAYLAIDGGLDVPLYLGSRATFTLGQFGGHGGRALRAQDMLPLGLEVIPAGAEVEVEPTILPELTDEWILRVIPGPHGAPDYFQGEDMLDFFTSAWEVHYNSSRTGVRLIGPKPRWARPDGGEAGLHPSNIHDNAYAIGAIDFTGDMPIILGPDGPSLGGFVCPAVIISADLWKVGQLRPGDKVHFEAVSQDDAAGAALELENWVNNGEVEDSWDQDALEEQEVMLLESPVIRKVPAAGRRAALTYRAQGDAYVLVEFGEPVLDLELRMLAHCFMAWLQRRRVPGIIDLTPGIRSLQVHYEPRLLSRGRLLDLLAEAERELPDLDNLWVPSRVVHLPLSWDDEATQLAIRKYMQSVRPDAPWCPSNIEFIRRINGLGSIDQVREIVYNASYLVMGLGDVYLGAPVATPLDPRHRLVTTKYNPARTWTPQNAVGIGGAYMCIYGMEGPGGYQFVGRTLQIWNTYRQTLDFTEGKPWLLRFFDQIRFYPVSAEELLDIRASFLEGGYRIRVEDAIFNLPEYRKFLGDNAESIADFRATQRQAFAEERERWKAAGQDVAAAFEEAAPEPLDEVAIPDGAEVVYAPLTGSLWKLVAQAGDTVAAGDTLAILEAMKMETPVVAEASGTVLEVRCEEGKPIKAGQTLFVLEPATEAEGGLQ
jgi:urea carboxylase